MNYYRENSGRMISMKTLAIIMLGLNCIFVFLNPDSYLGIADYFIFLVLFILFSFLASKKVSVQGENKFVIMLFVYLAISLLIAIFQGVFSTGYFFSYAIYLVSLLAVFSVDFTLKEARMLVNLYILSGVIVSILLFIQRYDFYGSGDTRHTLKILSHEAFDPNFLAAFIVVPAVLSFAKMIYRLKVINIITTFIIVAGVVYTSSRGAVLAMFIGCAIVALWSFRGKKKLQRLLLVAVLVAIGAVLLYYYVPSNSLSRIINIQSYKDSSNAKRLLDWSYGIQAFLEKPLLGYGLQGEMSIIKNSLGVNYIAHNTFLGFLLQFGIVGCSLIAVCLVRLFYIIRKNSILVAILITTLVVSIFVSAEVALFFWIPILAIVLIASCEGRTGKINEWL